jgi:hypothetical protein
MVKAYVNANLLENRYFVKIIRVIAVLDFYSLYEFRTIYKLSINEKYGCINMQIL